MANGQLTVNPENVRGVAKKLLIETKEIIVLNSNVDKLLNQLNTTTTDKAYTDASELVEAVKKVVENNVTAINDITTKLKEFATFLDNLNT